MMSIIQFLVDEGVFVEDPDGILWLSDEMKDAIDKLERSEKFLDHLEEIEDAEGRSLERWIISYLNFKGGVADKEITIKASTALVTWEYAARSNRLDEWSMKMRIR